LGRSAARQQPTRAAHTTVQIFTNDREKLGALGHDASHSSAHAPEMKPEQKQEQSFDIGLGL
jgi:hypothetical protein